MGDVTIIGAGLAGCAPSEPVSRTDFFMSTLVTQQAYGRGAEEALARAADTLGEWEQRFSLYEEDSDVCRINAAAGVQPVQVSEATAALLAQAKALAVEPGEALLCLQEAIFDQNGHPLHTSHQVIRGDRFTFRI